MTLEQAMEYVKTSASQRLGCEVAIKLDADDGLVSLEVHVAERGQLPYVYAAATIDGVVEKFRQHFESEEVPF